MKQTDIVRELIEDWGSWIYGLLGILERITGKRLQFPKESIERVLDLVEAEMELERQLLARRRALDSDLRTSLTSP